MNALPRCTCITTTTPVGEALVVVDPNCPFHRTYHHRT